MQHVIARICDYAYEKEHAKLDLIKELLEKKGRSEGEVSLIYCKVCKSIVECKDDLFKCQSGYVNSFAEVFTFP